MLVSGAVSRPGVYEYYAGEIPPSSLPDRLKNKPGDTVVRVLYPDSEVFGKIHLDSIANKPVTWGHPLEMVNSRNVAIFQRGFIRDNVKVKNGLVNANLVVQNAELIDAIEKGDFEELSTGIESTVKWEAGTDKEHGPYDASVHDIVVNHVAVVDKGRAGRAVRLDNKNTQGNKMDREITIGGITFTVNNQVAQAVEKLQKQLGAAETELKNARSALQNSEKETQKLQGSVAALEAQANDTARLDTLAQERQELLNKAKALDPDVVTEGQSNEEVVKAVVAKLSNEDIEGKPFAYVEGQFDTFVKLQNAAGNLNDDKARKKEAKVLKTTLEVDGDDGLTPGQRAFEARNKARSERWKK
jgi:hypothetical protein